MLKTPARNNGGVSLATHVEDILILAKTYPSPSAQYVETSCVAGINADGVMRRLYPVPFRLIEESQQFGKWQWITVRVEKARKDHRPESHRIFIDTVISGTKVDTRKDWINRWPWINRIPTFEDPVSLDKRRLMDQTSLALLKPKRVLALEITPARHPDWTDAEKEKLTQEQIQGNLFSEDEARHQIAELRKIPFDFHYRYVCDTPDGEQEFRSKIVDWEAGALYWNCVRSHGPSWEAPFRKRLEDDLPTKNLIFMVGNQHRFQSQWLIISLIYPMQPQAELSEQSSLF